MTIIWTFVYFQWFNRNIWLCLG